MNGESSLSGIYPLHFTNVTIGQMDAGLTVTLHGLRARADLNGRTGVLLQWLEVGRWLVEMDGSLEAVRVKPENLMISACSRPLDGRPLNGRGVAMDSAQLKARFMAVVQKYGFDSGAKLDAIADYMTTREPGEDAMVTCAAFAARLGTSEEEADALLTWLNVGFACKERYLYLAQEPSAAPSLRTTPSRSASSEGSQAAEAAVAALPAVASPAPPTAEDRLRDSFGAVSVRDDDRIAE